jgi:hypothetical protein
VGWNVVPCNESFFCSHRTGGGNGSCYVVNWRWNSLDLGNFQELFKHCCQGNLKATWKKDWTHDRISWNFLLSAAWMWTFRSLAPARGCSDWNSTNPGRTLCQGNLQAGSRPDSFMGSWDAGLWLSGSQAWASCKRLSLSLYI